MKRVTFAMLSLSLFAASCSKKDNQTLVQPATQPTNVSQDNSVPKAHARPTAPYWDIQLLSLTQSGSLGLYTLNVTFTVPGNGGIAGSGSLYYALCNASGVITGAWSNAATVSNGTASFRVGSGIPYGQYIAVYFDPSGGNYPVPAPGGGAVNATSWDHYDYMQL